MDVINWYVMVGLFAPIVMIGFGYILGYESKKRSDQIKRQRR